MTLTKWGCSGKHITNYIVGMYSIFGVSETRNVSETFRMIHILSLMFTLLYQPQL